MRYVIVRGTAPDAPVLHELSTAHLIAEVAEIAGRNVPFLDRALRRDGECYVATATGSPGRAEYGRGFIVRRVK